MGMFDSLNETIGSGVGSLGAGILNYMGTQSTNQSNADRADQANAWSASQYGSRYQTMTKDLEAAGLNPMLAYSQSPGSAPTAQQVTFQNPMSNATQAVQQTAQAASHLSSAHKADAEVSLVNANAKKVEEETKNIPDEGKRIRQMVQLLADQAALAAQKGETEVQVRKQIAATIKKIDSETELLNFDVKASKDLNGLGSESRQFKTIIDLIRAIK